MTADIENLAIEIYLDDELPHDRPWSELSESTREGYRQRAQQQSER